MKSSSVFPSALSRLMRRIATVTIAAPLAACAARMTSIEGYFPVPTISRESNSYLPIFSVSLLTYSLASCNGFDDFDAVALAQPCVSYSARRTTRSLHATATPVRAEPSTLEQRGDGQLVRAARAASVDRCLHA